MLMRQKVLNEGMRAMALYSGHQLDLSKAHPEENVRQTADDIVQIMTPVVKAFLTDEGLCQCQHRPAGAWRLRVHPGLAHRTVRS